MTGELKYLGTTFTGQNSVQEYIEGRLKAGNVCCHSEQNLLFEVLLRKNMKAKTYRTVILPVFCMGVKLGRPH